MMEVLNDIDPLLKGFWFVAIPVSLIFVVQTVMTFIGVDAADGLEADFDGNLSGTDGPFQLFSLRNLINFLLGFSWAGISFYNSISNVFLLLLACLIVGILFVMMFFVIIRQIQKLAEDNSFRFDQALHKPAEVYLTIPGAKAGRGRIMISIRGSVRELDAMTEQETIPTGSTVKVVRVESGNILIVEKI